jgi:hypothetical protein
MPHEFVEFTEGVVFCIKYCLYDDPFEEKLH